MNSLFYIGQKIVAIKDHSQGDFKKGDEFTVLDTSNKGCKCCSQLVKISNEFTLGAKCTHCDTLVLTPGPMYYLQTCFAPIQEISDFTYEEAIELVTQKETITI